MTTKKTTKTNSKKVVLVIWHDAHADPSGTWTEKEDICRKPYVVESCGHLLEGVKPNHVTLSQSRSHEEMYDSILHIPDAMVVDIIYLIGAD